MVLAMYDETTQYVYSVCLTREQEEGARGGRPDLAVMARIAAAVETERRKQEAKHGVRLVLAFSRYRLCASSDLPMPAIEVRFAFRQERERDSFINLDERRVSFASLRPELGHLAKSIVDASPELRALMVAIEEINEYFACTADSHPPRADYAITQLRNAVHDLAMRRRQ